MSLPVKMLMSPMGRCWMIALAGHCGLLLLPLAGSLSAQCNATVQFPQDPVEASQSVDTVLITDMQNAGQYAVITNLSLGQDYVFTADPADYITVRDVYDSSIVLDHGTSPLTYATGTGPDLVAVHIHLAVPACGTDAVPRVTTVHCATCTNPPAAGINTADPGATLEVDGKILVGSDSRAAEAGMIRWNSSNSDFEGYDGSKWRSLTKSESTWGTLQPDAVVENDKLTASDGSDSTSFGRSVSVSGDYAVVGAHLDNDQGAAYIFKRDGNAWVEQVKLTASDGATDDLFGWSVSISGDYAIVGAYNDDDNGSNSGSAYIFHRTGNTWIEQDKLTASDGAADDLFGWTVAISGDYAIVAADFDDDDGLNSGSAYIFHRNGSTWTEQDKLTASDAAAEDFFGHSVAIAGDYAIVGASFNDDHGSASGSAYIFHRTGSTWTEQDKLTASDADAGDNFGWSVAISGDYAVVAAPSNDDAGMSSGSAYVFKRDGSNWTQEDKLTASDAAAGDIFGYRVSLSGDHVILGAYSDDDNGSGSGSAYIFHRTGTDWSEQVKLTASDGALGDQFGISVAISGDDAMVGAHLDDDLGAQSGSAYFFRK